MSRRTADRIDRLVIAAWERRRMLEVRLLGSILAEPASGWDRAMRLGVSPAWMVHDDTATTLRLLGHLRPHLLGDRWEDARLTGKGICLLWQRQWPALWVSDPYACGWTDAQCMSHLLGSYTRSPALVAAMFYLESPGMLPSLVSDLADLCKRMDGAKRALANAEAMLVVATEAKREARRAG